MFIDDHRQSQWIVQAIHRQPFIVVVDFVLLNFGGKQRERSLLKQQLQVSADGGVPLAEQRVGDTVNLQLIVGHNMLSTMSIDGYCQTCCCWCCGFLSSQARNTKTGCCCTPGMYTDATCRLAKY